MTIQNYTLRPTEVTAVQWDGTNAAEITTFAETRLGITSVTQDGTDLNCVGGWFSFTLPVGWWLTQASSYGGMSDEQFQATYQPLTGAAPRAFDITES